MKFYFSYFLFVVFALLYLVLLSNTSGGPVQTTGAPSEATCGRSGCHAVLENQGDATIDISFNEGGSNYVADELYPVQVSLSNLQNDSKNGFQIVALDSLDNNIGSWLLTDETTTQIRVGNSLADRSYVTHTQEGVAQTTWSFNWQAPSELAGAVTFYLSVNDADNNGGRTGDEIYIRNITIEAGNSTSTRDYLSSQLTIFPNPTNGLLTLESGNLKILKATLFNPTGQLLFSRNNPTQLDIAHFPSGIYYLSLTTLKGNIMKKIVLDL